MIMKKRSVKPDLYGIDRISELPDSILGKILSCLPTKHAVATSVLSSRWNSLFPFWVPPVKLDLDDSLLLHPQDNIPESPTKLFTDFVDKILNKTMFDVPCLQVLNLNCENYYGDAKIIYWLCAALRLNIRELILNVCLIESGTLFRGLDGCITLKSLELKGRFIVCPPDHFTLPHLQVLVLFELTFDKRHSLTQLICGCPSLEDLSLKCCNWQCCGLIRIESLMVKKLTIKDSLYYRSSHDLHIYAPNLEVLVYDDCAARSLLVSNFESLRVAYIHVSSNHQVEEHVFRPYYYFDADQDEDDSWSDSVAKLVTACSSTSQLNLSACSIKALQDSPMVLPTFPNLTCFGVGRLIGSEGYTVLGRLIWKAPNLEKVMTIEKGFGDDI